MVLRISGERDGWATRHPDHSATEIKRVRLNGPAPPTALTTVTAGEKLSENTGMELTHLKEGASFTKSSWRCSHFVEGGTSERDLRDERGGPFHP